MQFVLNSSPAFRHIQSPFCIMTFLLEVYGGAEWGCGVQFQVSSKLLSKGGHQKSLKWHSAMPVLIQHKQGVTWSAPYWGQFCLVKFSLRWYVHTWESPCVPTCLSEVSKVLPLESVPKLVNWQWSFNRLFKEDWVLPLRTKLTVKIYWVTKSN